MAWATLRSSTIRARRAIQRPHTSGMGAAADAFFSNDLLDVQVGAGLDNIQLSFDETMSGGDGFSYDYAAAGAVSAAPLPSSWMFMLTGLVVFGFFAHRRARG